jgi:hypothetical protein
MGFEPIKCKKKSDAVGEGGFRFGFFERFIGFRTDSTAPLLW